MLGTLIRQRRLALGLTQGQLGLRLGVPQSYVSKLEKGRIDLPQRGMMEAMADALRVTVADLYTAAGVLQAGDTPDALDGDSPDDPLLDVLQWLREDPSIVADLTDAKATMLPAVYHEYVRAMAEAWASNFRMQRKTWRLAREG